MFHARIEELINENNKFQEIEEIRQMEMKKKEQEMEEKILYYKNNNV